MAGKRVAIITPDGRFDTIGEEFAHEVTRAGGRVLTKAQIAEHELAEAYDKQSTAKKIGGVASAALGPIGSNAAAASGAVAVQPEVEAFNQGVADPATLGFDRVAVKTGLEATQGAEAGKAYAEHQGAVAEAHPGWKTAGEVTGFLGLAAGGTAGATRALPGAGISALGGAAEAGAARALGGVASRGVIGRALATGGELAARGAVEGGISSAGQYASSELLQDHDLAADKLFAAMGTGMLHGAAGGAVLGTGGSLLASGARAAGRGVSGAMGRAMARGGETAAEDVARAEARAAEFVDEAGVRRSANGGVIADEGERAVGRTVREEAKPGFLESMRSVEGQKGLAYDQAWRSIGAGQGLQTTRYAGKAAKYLPNGTRDVGEVLMRKGIINAEEGVLAAAKGGTPAAILPRIESELETVGARIGEITSTSPARIDAATIAAAVDRVATPLESKLLHEPVAASVRDAGESLKRVLGIRSPTDQVTIQALLEQRKSLDKLVYEEAKALDPKGRVAALRDLRGEIEGVISDALDGASDKVAGVAKAEYKALKKDYLALSIAKEAADDSATRMSKNRMVSPTDYAAAVASAAGGHLMAAPVAAIGHKLARERGNAAAAVALYNAAERGTLTRAVEKMDALMGRASKGLLTPPVKGALPSSIEPPTGRPHERAVKAMKRVAEVQADPEAFADKVTRSTEAMGTHSPEIAGALAQRMVSAFTFLASKMPAGADPDPLDPHPAPHMTDADAATFARYDWYAQKPERFFTEVAHGKLTPEGAETAKALMPRAFAELQQRTADALATQMARGRSLPFQQRLVIGQLLDFAAVPSQRLDHMQLLQKNVNMTPPDAPAPKHGGGSMPTQKSALDRLEASGPGRR